MVEANLQRHGAKDSALRALYNADISLFGAPSFKPGTIIYIDTSAMGAGNTSDRQSLARKLGFGGYYFVLKAANAISTEGYTTDLECVWLSFGDSEETVKIRNVRNIKLIDPTYGQNPGKLKSTISEPELTPLPPTPPDTARNEQKPGWGQSRR